MKYKFLIALIILFITDIYAVDIMKSQKFALKRNSQVTYLGYDSSYYYAFTTKQTRRHYKLLLFNKSNLSLKQKIKIFVSSSRESIESIRVIDKVVVYMTSKINKGETIFTYYRIHLDSLNVAPEKGENFSDLLYSSSEYSIALNPNNFDNLKNYGVLSLDMTALISLQLSKNSNEEIEVFSTEVQDLLIQNFMSYLSEITIYDSRFSKNYKLVPEKNRRILELYTDRLKSGQIRVYGKYCESKNDQITFGLFNSVLNNENQNISINYQQINPYSKKNHFGTKLSVWDYFKKDNMYFKKIGTHENLLLVTSGSSYNVSHFQSTDMNGKLGQTTQVITNTYNNANIYNFTSDGKIVHSMLPLNQTTSKWHMSTGLSYHYGLDSTNNLYLVFTFFDHLINAGPFNNQTVSRTCKFGSNTVLMQTTYNINTGQFSEKVVLADKKQFQCFFAIEDLQNSHASQNQVFLYLKKRKSESKFSRLLCIDLNTL